MRGRGTKRRRESEGGEEDKLRRKLHHALKELCKVVRKAKTFEIQKTVKKLKHARCKDPESESTKELLMQVKILKQLSYEQLAHSALVTKLKKNKILSADPSVQVLLAEIVSNPVPTGTPGTVMTKVQSRILSSKIIASEVASVMENLRTFLYPLGVGTENEGTFAQHISMPNISKKKGTDIGREKDGSENIPSGDEEQEDTSSDERMSAVNDGWESGTVNEPTGSDDSVAGAVDDHEDNPFGQGGDDPTGNSRASRQPHRSKFLPGLSVGFTRGDSGSEISDNETGLVDGIKKNRRGQRARRAIWEKKFGKNANHIKKQEGQPGRRIRPLDRRPGRGFSSSRPCPTQTSAAYYHRERETRIRERQDVPLHPSWEAKKKNKGASIVPSQGSKIVFSEI